MPNMYIKGFKNYVAVQYATEVGVIAEVKHVPISDAIDMVAADIREGKAHPYNTGDILPNFDFAEALNKANLLFGDINAGELVEEK